MPVVVTTSQPNEAGFTISLFPAVDGLTAKDLALDNGAVVTDMSTTDNGMTYQVKAVLQPIAFYNPTLTDGVHIFLFNGFSIPPVIGTGTISSVSTTGFTVTLSTAVDGLTAKDFTLNNDASITNVTTTDKGATYQIEASLVPGNMYSLSLVKIGYIYTLDSIFLEAIPVTAKISDTSSSGFTVAFNPAIKGLTPKDIALDNDANVTAVTTTDEGATYRVSAQLTADKKYQVAMKSQMYAIKLDLNTISYEEEHKSAPSSPTTDAIVLVNGKSENAGIITTTTDNDRTIRKLTVDPAKVEEKLQTEGDRAVITIPVTEKSDVVVGELTGQTVKHMEQKQALLKIQTGQASYTLPAQQINVNDISAQIGKDVNLQDIKIYVTIAQPTAGMSQVVKSVNDKGTFSVVAPAVEFSISASYGDKTVDISKFNAYVERNILIPDGVDPNKITTGIVYDADGTVRHVPTKVVKLDDKYYAQINSLTNSTYSVVWHPLEFKDVAAHWAKTAVNDMGSRMVVTGISDDVFNPDQSITRAEFVTSIVRGLGLKPETGGNTFADVKGSTYAPYIQAANSYGLIKGYEDGKFHPQSLISREEAMTIIAGAMKLTQLSPELAAKEADALLSAFTDNREASDWAQQSIAQNLKAGLVKGRDNGKLTPKANITRAEVAVLVERLLKLSNLI